MPKKTKKEKLLAQHHRVHLPPAVVESRLPESVKNVNSFHLTLPVQTPTTTRAVTGSVDEFTAIHRDLVKTLIITGAIIISEFLLAHYLPH